MQNKWWESVSACRKKKKKRLQRGNLRLCFWAAICLLPLISSDRTNNTAKRRRSIRPSTCQTALDHSHVEDGRQIRPLAHGHSCVKPHATLHGMTVKWDLTDSPDAFRNSTCIGRNVAVSKSLFQILDCSDIRWNVFLCSIYWSNIQKKYIKRNHSNLALLKIHINRNIPTSFRSFGVTDTAERPEPTALKGPARRSVECSVASCLGSLHRLTATISTMSWRKHHFFPPLCWFWFSFPFSRQSWVTRKAGTHGRGWFPILSKNELLLHHQTWKQK